MDQNFISKFVFEIFIIFVNNSFGHLTNDYILVVISRYLL